MYMSSRQVDVFSYIIHILQGLKAVKFMSPQGVTPVTLPPQMDKVKKNRIQHFLYLYEKMTNKFLVLIVVIDFKDSISIEEKHQNIHNSFITSYFV